MLDNLGLGNAGKKAAVGIPGQTEETLLRTLRLANRATTQRMELTMVHPQPTRPDEASVARKPTDERQPALDKAHQPTKRMTKTRTLCLNYSASLFGSLGFEASYSLSEPISLSIESNESSKETPFAYEASAT